ncbi:MAG TPA: pyridoxamine 5'-phosphate oxidase family protein [Desulfobacterales bacterium]|nr:pyridoxamine 5'-phosphate oxidase family protein [Desulfobacterales bacterium]
MRKKEKEITNKDEIIAIITKAKVCRLAMLDGNRPYIVPLSFGYHDNALYFHGSLKGKKIDLIQENPNICFEFDHLIETVESDKACSWSMKFQSIIGFGKAYLLDGTEEKRKALSIIMAQYSNQQFDFPEKMLQATAVIKVTIESMTGKQSPPDH